jgi:hypothetical protein
MRAGEVGAHQTASRLVISAKLQNEFQLNMVQRGIYTKRYRANVIWFHVVHH